MVKWAKKLDFSAIAAGFERGVFAFTREDIERERSGPEVDIESTSVLEKLMSIIKRVFFYPINYSTLSKSINCFYTKTKFHWKI